MSMNQFSDSNFAEEKKAFEKRQQERKMQQAMRERQKLKGTRDARHAFKDQLEENTKE